MRTAMIIREIANTISPNTAIEVDHPSNHPSGWMPLLDIQVRVEGQEVQWKFYRKPVSSPFFLLNRSAVSAKVKRTMLAQEGLRRLRNTKPTMVKEEKKELMEDMAEMMARSGYPEDFRKEVLKASLKGYNKQVDTDEKGEKPLYRPREWKEQERRRSKLLKKAGWFRPADTVLFVPVTPHSELAGEVRKVVEVEGRRLGLRVRVVERGGVSLKSHLVRTDMSAGAPCPQGDCVLCETNPGEGGGLRHHRSGALYTGTCRICPEGAEGAEGVEGAEGFTAVYTGESGSSGYVRTGEHAACIERRDGSNAFHKHLADHHPGRVGDYRAFSFKVLKTFRKADMGGGQDPWMPGHLHPQQPVRVGAACDRQGGGGQGGAGGGGRRRRREEEEGEGEA